MAKAKAVRFEAGYDGAVEIDASVRMTATRWESRVLRCQPGTFEWRYGRKGAEAALYHAGIRFADLWERAGTASASSINYDSAGGGGQWKGLPDGRLVAMDLINQMRLDVGRWGMARLVDYCVMGTPSSVMADKYGKDERAMSHVLYEDLRAAALHFELL